MKKFEDYIRDQREEFDDFLPPEGHFKRFSEKLDRTKGRNYYLIRIAAIFILGILITGISFYSIRNFNMNHNIYASVDEDLKDAIYYYSSMNSEMEQEIEEMKFEDNSEKKQILKDIETYDEGINKIEQDLKDFPDDERVRNAVISHHKGKTALLNIIIAQ